MTSPPGKMRTRAHVLAGVSINSVERGPNMTKPRITFAQLRHLLLGMGFTETFTPKSHVFFAHQQSGAEIALPIYRANQIVMPHHVATVRVMLDYKGLMDGDAFDDFVASVSIKKVRNPWIDPRVVEVRSKVVQAYLVQHGWKPLAADQPYLVPFAGPKAGKNPPIERVPLWEHARDYSQRVIELVTDLALAEGRYAVEVLNELLQEQLDMSPLAGNGPRVKSKVH
jgi:predicted RNA binding protein YcfA (HicA-like mRNA interferase family)